MHERASAYTAIVLLSGLIGLCAWYSVKSRIADIHYVPNPESPAVLGKGVTAVKFDADSGNAENKFEAASIRQYSDDRIYASQPRATLYSDKGANTSVRGDEGVSPDGGASFVITGNARVTREATLDSPAMELSSPSLTCDTIANTVTTDEHVVLRRENHTTQGDGFFFDNAAQTLKIFRNVESTFYPKNYAPDLLSK